MFIRVLTGGPLKTNGYLVFDKEGGYGLAVDAPLGATRRYIQLINASRIELLFIVNTHAHWDSMRPLMGHGEDVGPLAFAAPGRAPSHRD